MLILLRPEIGFGFFQTHVEYKAIFLDKHDDQLLEKYVGGYSKKILEFQSVLSILCFMKYHDQPLEIEKHNKKIKQVFETQTFPKFINGDEEKLLEFIKSIDRKRTTGFRTWTFITDETMTSFG